MWGHAGDGLGGEWGCVGEAGGTVSPVPPAQSLPPPSSCWRRTNSSWATPRGGTAWGTPTRGWHHPSACSGTSPRRWVQPRGTPALCPVVSLHWSQPRPTATQCHPVPPSNTRCRPGPMGSGLTHPGAVGAPCPPPRPRVPAVPGCHRELVPRGQGAGRRRGLLLLPVLGFWEGADQEVPHQPRRLHPDLPAARPLPRELRRGDARGGPGGRPPTPCPLPAASLRRTRAASASPTRPP